MTDKELTNKLNEMGFENPLITPALCKIKIKGQLLIFMRRVNVLIFPDRTENKTTEEFLSFIRNETRKLC